MRPRILALAGLFVATAIAALSALSAAATLALALPPAGSTARPTGPSRGPVIADFGSAYAVRNPGLATPMLQEMKVRFDVAVTPGDVRALNPQLESAARFLNMHAKAGMSPERLKVAIVVHDAAAKDALSHEAYRRRHGIDNPNLALLDALKHSGARLYLCGQTAGSQGIVAADVAAPVQMALSATTAHLVLDADGYVLNPF
jgi:intracellular sulfur oxidation DsrE/DsrF family protein